MSIALPGPVATAEAIALLATRRFEEARTLLELLVATDNASPVVLVAYGVCLSELGETERAAEVARLLFTLDAPGLAASGLLDQARAWLPGGKLSRGNREALQNTAQRWLPRVAKQQQGGVR
jgi:hypothetical protein